MPRYKDLFFKSHDDLTLYARDYSAPASAPVLICIPGLTRNSADFEELCEILVGNYRILAVDLRGRGRSAFDSNPQNYQPAIYAQDIASLLQSEGIDSAIFIGTSLGGLVAMTLAAAMPDAVRGIVLNDVGPELNPIGLARIGSYILSPSTIENWDEAVKMTRTAHEEALPGLTDSQWQNFARRLYRENEDGSHVLNFDPRISVLFQAQNPDAPQVNLWPLFDSLRDIPMLVIRGAHSDILGQKSMKKMIASHPSISSFEVVNRGHAPMLNESGVVPKIEQFIMQCIEEQSG